MGEYEERYPDAYGRGDEPAAAEEPKTSDPSGVKDRSALRHRFGLATAGEAVPGWHHSQSPTPHLIEPTAAPAAGSVAVGGLASYRGVGPRGYVRPAERIYEDVCDRLTENPFIDASDIMVSIAGSEVTLAGSVESALVARQAEAIAGQVLGVSRVNNALRPRPARESTTAQR
jgi:hypothetical protein